MRAETVLSVDFAGGFAFHTGDIARRDAIRVRTAFCARVAPASPKGEKGLHYGNSRLFLACLNHFRNMSSVSIISVKPARLIFTVETIEGGPDSV